MKKVLFLFAMMTLIVSAKAYDFSAVSNGRTWYFNILSNNNVEVTYPYMPHNWANYPIPSGECIIPSNVTYNGTIYTVTGIGVQAFAICNNLTSITIPNTITYIGASAFNTYNNWGNVYVYYMGSLEQWCNISFANAASNPLAASSSTHSSTLYINGEMITNLVIPNTITHIGNYSFWRCTSITSVVIPNSVTIIGIGAFGWCCGLTELTISNSVITIDSSAFFSCTGLISLIIPNSVTSIGSAAFMGCSGLTAIIPNSVTSIGTAAFHGVPLITYSGPAMGRPWGATYAYYYNNDFIFEDSTYTTLYKYLGSSSVVTIPNTVTFIRSNAFSGCEEITYITLSNSLYTIGDCSFMGCSSLSTITIPNTVTYIGSGAFWNCSNLTLVNFNGCIPPFLGNDAISSDVTIGIPCGAYDSYLYAWGNRNYMEPNPNINLTMSVNDTTRGTVECILVPPMFANVRCDSTAVIQATANYGYHFDHWSTGSTQSLDTVHLTGDCTITAYFAKNQYTITALTNQGDRGSVTGSATVDYLDNVTLTATANYGYHFSHWSDGSTENPHQVSATQNMTIYAYFDPNQYLLNVQSADATMGNVSGDGSFDYLSNRTISASPNYGYHFEQWNDGMATSSRTVTLTQDTTFTASFGKNQYTLNVQSNDASLGTVTGSGTYEYLDTVEISATAIEHHHFVRWSDGNTNNPRNYQIIGDANITAIFAIDTHYVNVTCDIARGTVSGSGYYAYGSACTVMAENIYTGFVFHSWSNGVTANPYVFAVLDDIELYAIFVAEGEEVYTVTVESADPSMGTASGGGQALSGGEVVIWATSNPGHRFVRWNDNNTDSVRTVIVTADVTYTAYFEATTQSINDVMEEDIKIFVQNGQIVVDGVDDKDVRVFDMYGRLVDNRMLSPGVYLVKIGDHPARKVVVIR